MYNTEGDFDYEGAVDALTRVFGIAEICPVVILEDTGFEDLAEAVVSYVKELYPTEEKTFKGMRTPCEQKLIRCTQWKSTASWAAASSMSARTSK